MSEDWDKVTRALIYGTISTAIVSVLSLGGAFIIPLLKGPRKAKWMNFFIAMAVATLSSDAILHIIPQILGLHSHGQHEEHNHTMEGRIDDEDHNNEHGHGHSHNHPIEQHNHEEELWYSINAERLITARLSVILIVVYALYLMEFFFFHRKKATMVAKSSKSSSIHITEEDRKREGWTEGMPPIRSPDGENHEDEVTCCGLKSRAVVILFGDAIHNTVDGLAIGTSFLVSTKIGIVTSIAVACHELPHELGDLAVLLDSGLSMCRALSFNLISALTAFIGLYFSIFLGQSETAEQLLLALTAGMFLYVAWIDMFSHLKHDTIPDGHWLTAVILQFFGLLLGFSGIFALAWFEHAFEE